jgi:hypothetical protein
MDMGAHQFPSLSSQLATDDDGEDIKEANRVFFVEMTRAKQELHFTFGSRAPNSFRATRFLTTAMSQQGLVTVRAPTPRAASMAIIAQPTTSSRRAASTSSKPVPWSIRVERWTSNGFDGEDFARLRSLGLWVDDHDILLSSSSNTSDARQLRPMPIPDPLSLAGMQQDYWDFLRQVFRSGCEDSSYEAMRRQSNRVLSHVRLESDTEVRVYRTYLGNLLRSAASFDSNDSDDRLISRMLQQSLSSSYASDRRRPLPRRSVAASDVSVLASLARRMSAASGPGAPLAEAFVLADQATTGLDLPRPFLTALRTAVEELPSTEACWTTSLCDRIVTDGRLRTAFQTKTTATLVGQQETSLSALRGYAREGGYRTVRLTKSLASVGGTGLELTAELSASTNTLLLMAPVSATQLDAGWVLTGLLGIAMCPSQSRPRTLVLLDPISAAVARIDASKFAEELADTLLQETVVRKILSS